MDRLDRRILSELQGNGRLTNIELAERIGLSPSPCLRRVKALEDAGVIDGYSARINRQRIGLDLTVFVSVNIERHGGGHADRFRSAVLALDEVISCFIVSGETDFLLQVVAKNFETYRRFVLDRLLQIDGVKDIRSSFVMDVFKEASALPLSHAD